MRRGNLRNLDDGLALTIEATNNGIVKRSVLNRPQKRIYGAYLKSLFEKLEKYKARMRWVSF